MSSKRSPQLQPRVASLPADFDLWPHHSILDDGLGELCDLPLTVEETLLEVTLAGPGAESIQLLDSLQGRPMSTEETLEVAAAWERQSRWLSARQQAANVTFAGARVETSRAGHRDQDARIFELALAIDCSDQFLRAKLTNSRLLATTLRATAEKLETGELTDYRARIICDKLAGLDPLAAQWIEARVLPTAATITLASLSTKLRKLVLTEQGPEAVEQYLQGVANRHVFVDREPAEPGLLGLHAYLPAETTIAVREALETKAAEFARADKAARAKGGQKSEQVGERGIEQGSEQGSEQRRTKDQRLADALAWFVLGADENDESKPARPRFLVQLTMSLPTLLGLRDNAAELPGYGPIPAEIARMFAEDADWQRFVHEPVTGYLMDEGKERYRRSDGLHRFTQARDVKDRFPGSNRSARFGDDDHVEPYEEGIGGSTSSANLASLARIGHIAKTFGGWRCEGNANGALTWTSPCGRTYVTTPYDYSDEPEAEPEPEPDLPPPF